MQYSYGMIFKIFQILLKEKRYKTKGMACSHLCKRPKIYSYLNAQVWDINIPGVIHTHTDTKQ